MTPEERKRFLAARKSAIGASDISHVVMEGQWACSRKLYYDKTDAPEDFDISNKAEFRRGNRLEEVAARYYAEVTGRHIEPTGRFVSPVNERLACSPDRAIIDGQRGGRGILEVKVTSSPFMFRKNGLPPSYILQLQYTLAITQAPFGAFAVYAPVSDELLHFDVLPDQELGESLLEKASLWWKNHIDARRPPAALPEGSKPCEDCQFTSTCKKPDSIEF